MKRHWLVGMVLLVTLPAVGFGQSLSELAKQEKERRKKIEQSGKEVQVITDRELASNEGRIANPPASAPAAGTEASAPSTSEDARAESGTEARSTPQVPIRDDVSVDQERPAVTDIPADAELEEKLALFETMKQNYQQQVATIDAEIQENNRRLAEIQDELVSTGGTGLPTAPQADRGLRNPADIPALRSEQTELQQKNQALEAQKRSAKDDIVARARRAGIPAQYLNF